MLFLKFPNISIAMLKTNEVTRENFEIFLKWLNPNAEKAGDEYERLRFRLITFFSARKCLYADELADATLNRTVEKVSQLNAETIENKTSYVYSIAKYVYLESLRKEKTFLNIEDVPIASKSLEETDFSGECLDSCLKKLASDQRQFILEYFSESKAQKIALHKQTAAQLEISPTALRMKASRIKQKLSVCVKDCMN
jgi:DNA-directed RNA polymerase specialized sigma24 family protein